VKAISAAGSVELSGKRIKKTPLRCSVRISSQAGDAKGMLNPAVNSANAHRTRRFGHLT